MKILAFSILTVPLLCQLISSPADGAELFVSAQGANHPPFATWSDAATNIQDAIDAASVGDVVWVTNGVYDSGGKVMDGDLTNRVVLDKPLTVQSAGGPLVTTIRGTGATNGDVAVRCAWLTNGATLKGFTLEAGATRANTDPDTLVNGGGVWSASSNAILANCLIRSNTAYSTGAAVYRASLVDCAVVGNKSGSWSIYGSTLNHCTVASNFTGGVFSSTLTNCIVYGNYSQEYAACSLSHCCSSYLAPGSGNIRADPQLLANGFHLADTSPCFGAGTASAIETDLEGRPWAIPPAIGCSERQHFPHDLSPPKLQFGPSLTGVNLSLSFGGDPPLAIIWLHNGVPLEDNDHFSSAQTTNLVISSIILPDAGDYQAVVSNALGIATSAVAQVVFHYVDTAGTASAPPYTTWTTAATNIQDAIDAAAPGEFVWVTNGIYAGGGRSMDGLLTNRITVDKPLMVLSVNGRGVTTIQGAWDPSKTNGPLAVRCAWMTNGTILSGFTLAGGATREAQYDQTGGAGVLGPWTSYRTHPTNSPVVIDCLLTNNVASTVGGGAEDVALVRCQLTGNYATGGGSVGPGYGSGGGAGNCLVTNCLITCNYAADSGGGADHCTLVDSALTRNRSLGAGGGASFGTALNCTITGNVAGNDQSASGGGIANASAVNCIVYSNLLQTFRLVATSNHYNTTFKYSCTAPLPAGPGNFAADPQLLGDGIHLNPTSPCLGASTNSLPGQTDIDGQSWSSAPAIGCDEWWPTPVITTAPVARLSGTPAGLTLEVEAAGQDPFTCAWTKDGLPLPETAHYSDSQTTHLVIHDFGPADAGIYQVAVSNASRIATSSVLPIIVHCVDAGSTAPLPPYSNWANAAASIQDAIDAADAGHFVLVTNGFYATGGRVMPGGSTNRIVLTKPITVASVAGAANTVILGHWDPVTTNGPAAVRCAWLADGAALVGFTLTGGATFNNFYYDGCMGGGVWAASTNALISDCVISNNAAASAGGGCARGFFQRCNFTRNSSHDGGGACRAILLQCTLLSNTGWNGGGANQSTLQNCEVDFNNAKCGGGTYLSTLINCTVTQNSADAEGGGTYGGYSYNSLVYYNYGGLGPQSPFNNWMNGEFSYSCTTPLPSGAGNLTNAPGLIDWVHLSLSSPCRGIGTSAYVTGLDIDGEPWAGPPSIGCDELWENAMKGPLVIQRLNAQWFLNDQDTVLYLVALLSGKAGRVDWSFGDGTSELDSSIARLHTYPNPGDYVVTFTAFNLDNPSGASTNFTVHIQPRLAPALTDSGRFGTSFNLSFAGQPGATYVLERSFDLTPSVVWQPLAYVYSTGGVIRFNDPNATNAVGYYRVRLQ